jgi:hypothetical protein
MLTRGKLSPFPPFSPFVSIETDIGLRSPKNHDIELIPVTSVDINSTLFLTFPFQGEVIFDGRKVSSASFHRKVRQTREK